MFKELKDKIQTKVEEQEENVDKNEKPKKEDLKIHQKKLLTNLGYMNSYQALAGARNLPNSTQRKFLASKAKLNSDRLENRVTLMEEIQTSRKDRKQLLQSNRKLVKSI